VPLLACWILFAFGGAYTWTLVPLVAGGLLLAAVARPPIFGTGTRLLDGALVACVAIAAGQLIPLSPSTRLALSPGLDSLDRQLRLDYGTAVPRPLTADPEGTMTAVALAAGIIAFFWSARAIFQAGGLRRSMRAIAACGLAASALSILQHATSRDLLYWTWHPIDPSARPYTPFVNKNDLATWLIMAIPLTLGYIVTRVQSRNRDGGPLSLDAAIDETAIWLVASACAMSAALLGSLSRSGLIGGTVALLTFFTCSRGRMASRGRGWLLVGVAAMVVVGAMYVNIDAIMARLSDAVTNGVAGRREIWAATRAMIGDFKLLGVGVGAFERAMTVYQPPPKLFGFNHAHSEYLQVVAEGGVVLAAVALIAVVAGAGQAVRCLRRDVTPIFWTRAGAVSALAAIVVQSVWETGLRMPANAVLFAICAAVATHGIVD
jgi:O-antigen ligase